jgi:hypothetical protein
MMKSSKTRRTEHVTPKDVMRYAYNILVKTASNEEAIERPRRGWEDNIGMDLKKAGGALNLSISEERPVTGCIGQSYAYSDAKRGEDFDKLSGP